MENNEELLEYVKKIEKLNKKRLFYTRIATALLAVLVVAMLIILPTVYKTLNNANNAITTATETLEEASAVIEDMTKTMDTFEEAMSSVTKLVDDSAESLQAAFDNINSIDFEGLNSAIEDLGNVVEPLSKFFGAFK